MRHVAVVNAVDVKQKRDNATATVVYPHPTRGGAGYLYKTSSTGQRLVGTWLNTLAVDHDTFAPLLRGGPSFPSPVGSCGLRFRRP
jgi:hypothetical protein